MFRMESFFWVAGFLSANTLRRRSAADYLVHRLCSLGVPLIFCSLLFSGLDLLLPGSRSAEIPSAELESFKLTVHLWFLETLICCSVALAVCFRVPLLRRIMEKLRSRNASMTGFLVSVGLLGFAAMRLTRSFPPGSWHWPQLLDHVDRFCRYGFWFGLGYYLYFVPALLESVLGAWKFNLVNAFLFPFAWCMYDASPHALIRIAVHLWHGCFVVSMLAVMIGACRFLVRGREAAARTIAGAGFTIYLFHWPVMDLLSRYGTPANWSSIIMFLWFVVVAGIVSWAIHRLIVLKMPLMAFLINGVRPSGSCGLLCLVSSKH